MSFIEVSRLGSSFVIYHSSWLFAVWINEQKKIIAKMLSFEKNR